MSQLCTSKDKLILLPMGHIVIWKNYCFEVDTEKMINKR